MLKLTNPDSQFPQGKRAEGKSKTHGKKLFKQNSKVKVKKKQETQDEVGWRALFKLGIKQNLPCAQIFSATNTRCTVYNVIN